MGGVSFDDHYLNDFLTLGSPNTIDCADNFGRMLEICRDTGTTIETEKLEGRTTKPKLLDIEIDSSTSETRLPPDKLEGLKDSVTAVRAKKLASKETCYR